MISIIVPIYNSEKYLCACLDSLLSQTFKDIEILCINDGSTDNCIHILEQYASKDNRIRIFDQCNSGISASRNRGILEAKGEYLVFIDSDDTAEINFIESMYNCVQENQSDIVVCDFYEYKEASKEKTEKHLPSFTTSSVVEKPSLLFDINSSPWNKMYKSTIWMDVEFPLNLKYEDAYAVLVVLLKAKRISKVDACLLNYWIHEGSETTVVDKRVFDIFTILTMLKDYAETCDCYDIISPYLEYFAVNRITVYMLQQVYQRDEKCVKHFIDEGFSYLDTQFPKWRKNEYFQSANGFLKYQIKTKPSFMNSYVSLMRKKR